MRFNELVQDELYLFQTTIPGMSWFMSKLVATTNDGFVFDGKELVGLQIDQQGGTRPFPLNPFADEELEIKATNILTICEAPRQFKDMFREITGKIQVASSSILNGVETNFSTKKKV